MTEILASKPMVAAKKQRLARASRQFRAQNGRPAQLTIMRDSADPVITKYVELKKRFGAEVGVTVADCLASTTAELRAKITAANENATVDGVILQLPIRDKTQTEEICNLIAIAKDVDGLRAATTHFRPATVKAILDLLAFYRINLHERRIAVVGRGKLVGAPLLRVLKAQQLEVEMFHRGSDLTRLRNFDLIITATGVAGLIQSAWVAPNTVLVDAGTASEKGVLKGDLAPELYDRSDLAAITPKIGGVGPATVACLFENLLTAARLSTGGLSATTEADCRRR